MSHIIIQCTLFSNDCEIYTYLINLQKSLLELSNHVQNKTKYVSTSQLNQVHNKNNLDQLNNRMILFLSLVQSKNCSYL